MGRPGRHNPALAKEFRYTVDLRETLRSEDGTPLGDNVSWTPEHLLLAALIRCTLKSLAFHARRAGNAVTSERATGRALFTKRASDGRYAATEIDLELGVQLRTQPGEDELRDLLAKAERDCFIGASLTTKPRYVWSVS
jgi:organic hydroperoxide reductase OsmC/OhrA